MIPSSAWERRRALDLLRLLALAPGHRLHRDQIIGTLWPDKEPSSGANNLHRALHDLRKTIGSEFVGIDKGFVRLGDEVWVDVAAFESLITSKEAEKVIDALDLYRGNLEADDPRRDLLRGRFVEASLRVARQADLQDRARAMELLRHVVEIDPAEEEAHRLLIRFFAEAGRRQEALRQYEVCEKALRAQLDVEPSQSTRELYASILRGDSAAAPRQATGATRVARRLLGSTAPPPLRGRAEALSLLQEFTAEGSGVLLLVGEAGIGKTRIAAEGARMAERGGAVLMSGAAIEFEGSAPYAPFVEAWTDYLRATGQSLDDNPFLIFAPTPGGNPQEDKLRLFQLVQQSLERIAAGRPLYLVIDDLHFADESSLHLFHYLARSTRTVQLMLVGTLREEELAVNAPLHALASALYRERLCRRLFLNRLDRQATRQLIDDRLGREVDDQLSLSIYRLTEGNPFYTEELVQTVRERSADVPTLSADLTTVVEERVRRLGVEVEQFLTAASVIGQNFAFRLAQTVSGLPPDNALNALEKSLAAKLLEDDEAGCRFRHALVRESLYRRLSRARRTEAHRAVGEALEQEPDHDERVEELAYHFRAAGDLARALPYLIAAGKRAAARLGLAEAVAFFEQGLQAMDALKLPPDQKRFKVLVKLGQMNFSLSNLEPAVHQLDTAAALLRSSDGWRPSAGDRAKARRCAALALITAGDLDEANRRLEAAMADLAGEENSREYPHVLYHLAQLRWHEGRHQDAYAVAERCLREAEKQGDPQVIAKGYEILSLSCHSLGEWRSGIEFEEKRRALVGSTVDVAQAFDVHL